MSTKIISVFGSSGSGKSMISLLTAEMLSREKHNVCVISIDKLTPMLSTYCPFIKTDVSNSLAKLLTNNITSELLKECIHLSKHNNRLSFVALATGDNLGKYPDDFTESRLSELVNVIVDFDIDYFIFDLTSNIYSDSIISYILKNSDNILYILNPTPSSISFVESNSVTDIDLEKTTFILNDCFEYSPTRTVKKERQIKYTVHNERFLYESYITGDFTGVKDYFPFVDEVLL